LSEKGGFRAGKGRERERRSAASLEKKRCGSIAALPNCSIAATTFEDCATRREERNTDRGARAMAGSIQEYWGLFIPN
jgi:hypothetical protein